MKLVYNGFNMHQCFQSNIMKHYKIFYLIVQQNVLSILRFNRFLCLFINIYLRYFVYVWQFYVHQCALSASNRVRY